MKKINKRSKIITVCLLLMMCIIMVTIMPASAATWTITGSTFTHDPTIIKEGSLWWQFYTAQGIGVKYSMDGKVWNQGVQIFSSKPSWWATYVPQQNNLDVWAPDISYSNGRYWLYYSISTFRSNVSAIGLVSCTSIRRGDWRDDGLVMRSTSSNDYNCIDPNLIVDASGNKWLALGSFWSGIKLTRVDNNTMKPIGSMYSIAKRPNVANNPVEAPHIVYNNGYYYLFVSFDSCCQGTNSTYKIAYGRSRQITGPYTDKNGTSMMSGGGTILDQTSGQWVGPGGQFIYKNGSSWLCVHHAYDSKNNGIPALRIKDLYFDSSNWPTY